MSTPSDGDVRRARRVAATFRVRYHSIDRLVMALTHDVSRGGVFMRTERFLPINAVVRVHLELPDGGGDVPVICRVAFVRGVDEAAATGKPAGMGVEFLDLDEKRAAELLQRAADPTTAPAPRRPRDIVVVDDDENIRRAVRGALGDRGDKVREARDGLEALALCLKQAPDLVLTDVQMPRMDGWQLTRMLRARPSLSRVPVIMFTTLTDDAARLRGYRLGVDDYINKPTVEDELLARVDRVLARGQSPTASERRSLRGDLEHVTLASLLSFLALEQKTGVLLLVGDALARIYLRAGTPLRAEIDDVPVANAGDPALYALLGWSHGQFEFAAGDVACADELGTSVNALLLEHARRTDESSR